MTQTLLDSEPLILCPECGGTGIQPEASGGGECPGCDGYGLVGPGAIDDDPDEEVT